MNYKDTIGNARNGECRKKLPHIFLYAVPSTHTKKKLHIHHFSEAQFIGVIERENHHKSSTVSFGGPQLMNQKTTV